MSTRPLATSREQLPRAHERIYRPHSVAMFMVHYDPGEGIMIISINPKRCSSSRKVRPAPASIRPTARPSLSANSRQALVRRDCGDRWCTAVCEHRSANVLLRRLHIQVRLPRRAEIRAQVALNLLLYFAAKIRALQFCFIWRRFLGPAWATTQGVIGSATAGQWGTSADQSYRKETQRQGTGEVIVPKGARLARPGRISGAGSRRRGAGTADNV